MWNLARQLNQTTRFAHELAAGMTTTREEHPEMAENDAGMNTDAGSADSFLLMDGIESVHHVAQAV